MLRNEKVRAVGNMDVNARGDKIDSQGNTVVSRARQVGRNLKKQTVNTSESPVLSSQQALKTPSVNSSDSETPPESGIQAALNRAQKPKS